MCRGEPSEATDRQTAAITTPVSAVSVSLPCPHFPSTRPHYRVTIARYSGFPLAAFVTNCLALGGNDERVADLLCGKEEDAFGFIWLAVCKFAFYNGSIVTGTPRMLRRPDGKTPTLVYCIGTTVTWNTGMRRLTTAMRSEKCVVRRFRRRANVVVYLHKPRQYSIVYCTPRFYGIAYCS